MAKKSMKRLVMKMKNQLIEKTMALNICLKRYPKYAFNSDIHYL